MLPWGHAAVGYVLSSLWSRVGDGPPLTDEGVWLLLFATQLPDVVDKTLSWSVPLLPSGRSLAHSALTTAAVVAVAVRIGRRFDAGDLAAAFSLGYVTHIATDALPLVARGETEYLTFLLWPVVPTPYDPSGKTLLGELALIVQGGPGVRDLLLLVVLVVLWAADGFPGLPWRWASDRRDRRRQTEEESRY